MGGARRGEGGGGSKPLNANVRHDTGDDETNDDDDDDDDDDVIGPTPTVMRRARRLRISTIARTSACTDDVMSLEGRSNVTVVVAVAVVVAD